MKKTSLFFGTLFFVILILFSGCRNFFGQPITVLPGDSSGEKGYVQLRFNTSQGKTLLPDNLNFTGYYFTITITPENDGEPVEIVLSDILKTQFELETGNWTLGIEIFSDSSGLTLVASAFDIEFEVETQGDTTVTVPLVFEKILTGNGSLSFNITKNPVFAHDQAEVRLIRLDKTTDDIYYGNKLAETKNGIPAGYYLAVIRLEKNLITPAGDYNEEQEFGPATGIYRWVWSDILHIYPDQTTNLAPVFDPENSFIGIKEMWLFSDMTDWDMVDFTDKSPGISKRSF